MTKCVIHLNQGNCFVTHVDNLQVVGNTYSLFDADGRLRYSFPIGSVKYIEVDYDDEPLIKGKGLSAASIIAMADAQTYHVPVDSVLREGEGIFNAEEPSIKAEGSE